MSIICCESKVHHLFSVMCVLTYRWFKKRVYCTKNDARENSALDYRRLSSLFLMSYKHKQKKVINYTNTDLYHCFVALVLKGLQNCDYKWVSMISINWYRILQIHLQIFHISTHFSLHHDAYYGCLIIIFYLAYR